MVKVAPSILSCDFTRLGEELKAMEAAGADFHHLDVMDGRFVPNISFGPPLVAAAAGVASVPLDVHLMIEDPLAYIPVFVKAGAALISFHAEAAVHHHKLLTAVRAAGASPGLALNPSTPVDIVGPMLNYLDFVLIMGVNPGFSGQGYIPETTARVAELRVFLKRASRPILIEVDGGVSDLNAGELRRAGADILVSGSFLYGSRDYAGKLAALKD